MGARIGSMHFMYNYQNSLNYAYQQQTKLFEQSDGSSLHRASDNPMNYAKLLRYNVSQTENTQYRDNLKTASSWMKNSDDVMIHMTEIMQTLKEKSVQAANSDNTEDDYAAIYKEMYAGMQELVSTANSQIGDRYLFSGQKDLTKPFEMSLQTYERGQAKTLDRSQASFFKGSDADYNTELFQMLTVTEGGETYYLDVGGNKFGDNSTDGNLYTKEFIDSGYKELIALGCLSIKDAEAKANSDPRIKQLLDAGRVEKAGDFKVSEYFNNQGLLKDETNKYFVTIGGKDYKFVTAKQNIVTYNGDENLISMVKLNGATDPGSDTVNSTGAAMFGRDIFDNDASGNTASGTAMMNQLFGLCEKVNNCDIHWLSSDGVTISDVAHSTMVIEETRIGARQQLYNSVESMLDNQADNITEDITNVSGADIAQLATKLMQQTTLYNLALSIGGRILPQSLADYL